MLLEWSILGLAYDKWATSVREDNREGTESQDTLDYRNLLSIILNHLLKQLLDEWSLDKKFEAQPILNKIKDAAGELNNENDYHDLIKLLEAEVYQPLCKKIRKEGQSQITDFFKKK